MWLSVRRKYLDDFVSANSELLFQRYIDALIKAVFSDEQIIDDFQKEVMHACQRCSRWRQLEKCIFGWIGELESGAYLSVFAYPTYLAYGEGRRTLAMC